jgi:hypothetical protein
MSKYGDVIKKARKPESQVLARQRIRLLARLKKKKRKSTSRSRFPGACAATGSPRPSARTHSDVRDYCLAEGEVRRAGERLEFFALDSGRFCWLGQRVQRPWKALRGTLRL